MKGRLRAILALLGLFAVISVMSPMPAEAKITIKKSRTISLESGESVKIKFTTYEDMMFVTPLEVKNDDYLDFEKGGVKINLTNEEGDVIQNDLWKVKGMESYVTYWNWFYSDYYIQEAGTYTYTFKNTSNADIRLKYSIVGYTGLAKTMDVKSTISIKSGTSKVLKLNAHGEDNFPMIDSIKKSNPDVVSDVTQYANGNLEIQAKKLGNCTLTIKLLNGKKYKIKVTVTRNAPDFNAFLVRYNTRDNYFMVEIHNNGADDLTVLRSNAKVEDVDYKTYDRKIKSASSVTVSPGKKKNVKFYVKGSITWPYVSDFTLFSQVKYQGKTYEWHVWDDDSVIKIDNKWYTSYWY